MIQAALFIVLAWFSCGMLANLIAGIIDRFVNGYPYFEDDSGLLLFLGPGSLLIVVVIGLIDLLGRIRRLNPIKKFSRFIYGLGRGKYGKN